MDLRGPKAVLSSKTCVTVILESPRREIPLSVPGWLKHYMSVLKSRITEKRGFSSHEVPEDANISFSSSFSDKGLGPKERESTPEQGRHTVRGITASTY